MQRVMLELRVSGNRCAQDARKQEEVCMLASETENRVGGGERGEREGETAL